MTRVELVAGFKRPRLGAFVKKQSAWSVLCDEPFRAYFLADGLAADRLAMIGQDGGARSTAATVLVCTTGDEAAEVRKAEDGGAKAIGLFANLLPRLLAGAPPRFNMGAAPDPERRYALIGLPRSGSTALAQELTALGAGAPAEHLREPIIAYAAARDLTGFKLKPWWTMLTRSQAIDGTFGTKLIWGFLKGFMDKLHEPEVAWLRDQLRLYRIFYLRRDDKVEQAVSDYVARSTRVWHRWQGIADYEHRLERMGEVDYDEVQRLHLKFQELERELEAFLEGLGVPVTIVPFDDIAKDAHEQALAIGKAVGVTPDPARSRPELVLQRTHSPQHAAIAEHFRRHILPG